MHRIGAMKSHVLRPLAFVLALGAGIAPVQATKYTYHGDLMDGDAPAEGAYDLRVRAFAQPGATKTLAEPTELPGVKLHEGRFSVELDLPEDADGTTWVEVAVRKTGSSEAFEKLGAPQPLGKVNSTCPGAWALDGNSGMPAGSFLGIADVASTQTLDFRVQGRRGLRLQPNTIANTLSVVAGHPDNTVVATALGGTIGGGGRDGLQNFVAENFGTVAGGTNNIAGNPFAGVGRQGGASVGGGEGNWALGNFSTIPGGINNRTDAAQSLAAGTRANIATAHTGTFAWADSQNVNFDSTGPNQFLIRADGGVGINTATFGNAANLRASELMIKNSSVDPNTDITLLNTTNRGYNLVSVPGAGGAAGEFFIGETDARTAIVGFANRLRIDANGTTHTVGGVVGDLSDARLKKNFAPIEYPLKTLLALRGTMFEYLDPAKAMSAPGPRMGFIAQEVEKVLPNWVHPSMDGYLSVGTIGFEALAVEAIRDLKIESDLRIEALERENAGLQLDNAQLRSDVDAIARRLQRLESRSAR